MFYAVSAIFQTNEKLTNDSLSDSGDRKMLAKKWQYNLQRILRFSYLNIGVIKHQTTNPVQSCMGIWLYITSNYHFLMVL